MELFRIQSNPQTQDESRGIAPMPSHCKRDACLDLYVRCCASPSKYVTRRCCALAMTQNPFESAAVRFLDFPASQVFRPLWEMIPQGKKGISCN